MGKILAMPRRGLTNAHAHGPRHEMMEKSATTSPDIASLVNNDIPTVRNPEHVEKPQRAILRSPRGICSSVHPPSPSELSINECCAPRAPLRSPPDKKMGISKSNRIIILLVIDSAFFLLELVVGKQCCHHFLRYPAKSITQAMLSIHSLSLRTHSTWFVLDAPLHWSVLTGYSSMMSYHYVLACGLSKLRTTRAAQQCIRTG